MNLDNEPINGACHCGAVRFQVTLAEGLRSARRCDCSYCRMRGAVAVTAHMDDFWVISGGEALSVYQFGTKTARHFFCSKCGIYTHHQRRSNPAEFGVNVACLEGLSPFDFAEIPVNDGINHPADTGDGTRLAGILKFIPNPG